MRRNTLNFIVDTATFVVFLGIVCTGLLLKFVLPPGSRGGAGLSLWGWGRHDFGDVHFWLCAAALGLLILHTALHWGWVVSTMRNWWPTDDARNGRPVVLRRNLWGLGFLTATAGLVAAFLLTANANVASASAGARGRDRAAAVSDDPCDTCTEEEENCSAVGAIASKAESLTKAEARESDDDPCSGCPELKAALEGCGEKKNSAVRDEIRGSMTLREVSAATGVPLGTLKVELRLPDGSSPDARLSDMQREHGIEMSAVREAISRHRHE